MPNDDLPDGLTRLYAKIDEYTYQAPRRKKPNGPLLPLTCLVVFLICTIFFEERARYLAELEIAALKAKVSEQEEALQALTEKPFKSAPAVNVKPTIRKRLAKARKPKLTGQNLQYSNGYGERGSAK